MSLNLLALLRSVSKDNALPRLSPLKPRQVKWIIEAGLGPLVWFVVQKCSNGASETSYQDFRAADLTARLINQIQLEILSEILIKSENLFPPITLLKGSSTGSELYPEPHLRIMGDLDLLVNPGDQAKLETILRQMGFQQRSSNSHEFYARHHHSMPFYHSDKGVWVEVHRALFPASHKLGRLPVFSTENIRAELRPTLLAGIPVMRLSAELQIVYTASHWALELKRAGGLFGLLDIIYLLKRNSRQIRWDAVVDWVEGSVSGTHLYLVLSYLNANDIVEVDKGILTELFRRQKSFGTLNLKIAHALITRYLVAGKIPLAAGKIAMLWEALLQDQGPARNLLALSKRMVPCFGFRRATLDQLH